MQTMQQTLQERKIRNDEQDRNTWSNVKLLSVKSSDFKSRQNV